MNFDVVSIGAATVDILFTSADVKVIGSRISFAKSSKKEISQSLICSGGGATNSAVTFSRLKLKSACISLLGTDPLSDYILSDLKKDQVDPTLLVKKSKEITDHSIIFVTKDGSRTVFTNRGHSRLSSSQIPWSRLKKTRCFYITSLEGNLDLLEQIIGFAKENHIYLALNPGNREIAHSRRLISLIRHCDFLLLNRTESEILSGYSHLDSALWNYYQGLCPIVAITNGRQGAHFLTSTSHLYSPIINTIPADETGAGDAFGSAALTAILRGQPPETALEWGIKNSASVVSYFGAKTGILTLSQIKKDAIKRGN